jgi:hypothetical protein
MYVRAWVALTLAYAITAAAGETPVETPPPPPRPPQAASLAPATPSQPVAPSQPAAPSAPQAPPTIPVVATEVNRPPPSNVPTATADAAPNLLSTNFEYFCQTLAADGDHRTKYVSRVFPSAATSQSLTTAWLDYLQATYHVDRSASGSCARVAKTFEQTLPDREKQWQAMSFNVVHVDWRG